MADSYIIDVIVDLQNDFVDGALGTPEAWAMIGRAAAEARRAAEAGHALFFTLDTHGPDYLASREGGDLPVPHCIRGTEGHRLAPAVAAVAEADISACPHIRLVEKDTFGARDLPGAIADFLAGRKAEKFRVWGLCTDICVISNAMLLRAFFPEVPIEILADCSAGVTPESHATALAALAACQCRIRTAADA